MDAFVKENAVNYFEYETLDQLSIDCVEFYNKQFRKSTALSESIVTRCALTKWIRAFHQDCGTLTSDIEASAHHLEEQPCLLLMTAHQPNLFAYSGVFRKITLMHILAKHLSQRLRIPVVGFFGIADQDFTDNRWVKSALLPDFRRRNGILELRANLPEKLMLNKIEKPSIQLIDAWRNQIENWYNQKGAFIDRSLRALQLNFIKVRPLLAKNFDIFWEIVERAWSKAKNFADFNAFILSQIVNITWDYPTVFARFSECQQIFQSQFCFLLSHFQDYSQHLRGVTTFSNLNKEVSANEYKIIPFWYHCECGSKVRLEAEFQGDSLIGKGACIRCRKEYVFDFLSKTQPKFTCALSDISARHLSMPLIFFEGLKVSAYVGGVGGREYLLQAKYLAEKLVTIFPPVVIWRPHDVYAGISQLEALLFFKIVSGTFDLSMISSVISRIDARLKAIEALLQHLNMRKVELTRMIKMNRNKAIREIIELTAEQKKIRSETGFTVMTAELELLENIIKVAKLYPCIIDYAVNVGISELSKQWLAFLESNRNLLLDVPLQTEFAKLTQILPAFFDVWRRLQSRNLNA